MVSVNLLRIRPTQSNIELYNNADVSTILG